MQKIDVYKIPHAGEAREALREKGQFWTPDWIAEAMTEYVLAGGSKQIFDPAVGAGAFFRAAKTIARERRTEIALAGMDIDRAALKQAQQFGISTHDLANVRIGDFIFDPPKHRLKSIVANPPYIRHHRLSPEIKEMLRRLGAETTGKAIDGRAGLHVYFLIRALQLLDEGGRLAFIMPADTCEGVFAHHLWNWVAENYCIDAVVTFNAGASPFPQVDTNPIIFMIRDARPNEAFSWVHCHQAGVRTLRKWIASGFNEEAPEDFTVTSRNLNEAITTGLSRWPIANQNTGPTLGDFAKVLRGVATGANDYFFLTAEQAKALKIPNQYFVTAIGRTRDVPESEITPELIAAIQGQGRPTFLLSLNGKPIEEYPASVRDYLRIGEEQGLPDRPLISQRRPWYKMESRTIPPYLFAYLGRRNSRFIRNTAGVIPLTCFLCVYPLRNDPAFIDGLGRVLNHPETIANLPMIGKSYGSGAVKVEPRGLEKLPLPERLVKDAALPYEMRLF